MKTVVTELTFLFVWISLLFGRVLLTGGNRPKFCSLPEVTGPCPAAFPRWYYNIDSGKCEQFTYGGCDGNENNFKTKDECEGNCTTNADNKDHPSRLFKLFARKSARATDKTSVMFRRRLGRELNSTSSHISNVNEGENKSSGIPGTPSSNLTQENSTHLTSNKTNLLSHGESKESDGRKPPKFHEGSNANTTRSPSQPDGRSRGKTNESPTQPQDRSRVKPDESPTQPQDGSRGKPDESPTQPADETSGDFEDTLDDFHFQNSRKDSSAYPYEHTSSHFAAFFLTSIVMVFAAYVVYHNRQKIIAIVIEGRSDGNGRRRGYRKLETNVEEAMPSLKSSNSTYVY